MRIHAQIGVGRQERLIGNDFEVSVAVKFEAEAESLLSDELDSTLNYAHLTSAISSAMAQECALIETAAARIVGEISRLAPHNVGGSVTVSKLTPPIAGIELNRASATIDF